MVDSYNRSVDAMFEEIVSVVDLSKTVVLVQDFYLFGTNQSESGSHVLYPHWHNGQLHVKAVADEYGIPVAQVWDDFMGTDGEVINLVEAGLVDQDGIHPTADGAERMTNFIHDLGYQLTG